jgi:Type IV secretion-system coupling protein DNA-binding domain
MVDRKSLGQEITFNEAQIAGQNFLRLILQSMALGLFAALIWWSLFAPQDAFRAINLYWYSVVYCFFPFGCSDTALANIQYYQTTINKLGGVWQACTYVFAGGTFTSIFGLSYLFEKRGKELEESKILRGARLLSAKALKKKITSDFIESSFDLKLGTEAVSIPEKLIFRHMSFVGESGTGKTQAINSLLVQLQGMPNQKVMIIDLNGQYYSRFGRPQDKILSLYDKRTQPWTPWVEKAQPEFFAEVLVEEKKGDPFFPAAGRALLSDLLSINDNIAGLWKDLTSGQEKLIAKLQGGISPALLGSGRQAEGVIGTTILKLSFLRKLNHWCDPRQTPFSITDWATNQDESWVYLIVRDQDLPSSRDLLRLWVDLAVLGLLQRDENKDYPRLGIVADEMPGIGKLPGLGKLASQGRKYKGFFIGGWQAPSQIEGLWGKEGAKEIFQGLQTKLVFRSSDPDEAKYGSGLLGEQEIEEITQSVQFGTATTSDRNSLNRAIKMTPTVMSSEIEFLDDLKAYVKIVKYNPCLIKFEPKEYPAVNQPTDCEIPPSTYGKAKDTDSETDENGSTDGIGKKSIDENIVEEYENDLDTESKLYEEYP